MRRRLSDRDKRLAFKVSGGALNLLNLETIDCPLPNCAIHRVLDRKTRSPLVKLFHRLKIELVERSSAHHKQKYETLRFLHKDRRSPESKRESLCRSFSRQMTDPALSNPRR